MRSRSFACAVEMCVIDVNTCCGVCVCARARTCERERDGRMCWKFVFVCVRACCTCVRACACMWVRLCVYRTD